MERLWLDNGLMEAEPDFKRETETKKRFQFWAKKNLRKSLKKRSEKGSETSLRKRFKKTKFLKNEEDLEDKESDFKLKDAETKPKR